jgi:hypothetical protein
VGAGHEQIQIRLQSIVHRPIGAGVSVGGPRGGCQCHAPTIIAVEDYRRAIRYHYRSLRQAGARREQHEKSG